MKRLEAVLVSLRRDADRWLLGAAALALVATFLRPGLNVDQPLFEHVVVFDVTQSMNVEDEQLDGKPIGRLKFAKHALREALLAMPCGSRLGLGIFTEYRSFLLFAPVEVCANLGELRSTLERIDGRMAWIGNSEVAKGLYSGLAIVRQLPATPSLVFVTDGQEAPPLSPRHRPPFDGKRGEVKGLIVGVGDLKLSPIPKTDPLGRPLGYWGADEVLQVDPRSLGRGASVGGEQMTEEGSAPAAPLPGATPGSEHLSSLREAYLQLLANQTGLGYRRLADSQGFIAALTAPSLARPVAARADLRFVPAGIALLLLLARHGLGRVPWRARVRQWRQRFALRARSA
jgi:mxaL protein